MAISRIYVPPKTRQGNKTEWSVSKFYRPTEEYATGWEHETGRPAGSRIEFDKQKLQYCLK